MLHRSERRSLTTKQVRETEAEAVAFVVCQAIGLEAGTTSADYMPALIERVRSGTWNPKADEGDREQRNAMAARGYWQAFQAVQKSLGKIMKGEKPGEVAYEGEAAGASYVDDTP